MNTIGSRISDLRRIRGYTQERLAELANISIQFLSDIENNKKNMTVTTLIKLADSLHVSSDYIIYGRDSSSEYSVINAMMDTLSDKDKKNAEKLLEVFINAVNNRD